MLTFTYGFSFQKCTLHEKHLFFFCQISLLPASHSSPHRNPVASPLIHVYWLFKDLEPQHYSSLPTVSRQHGSIHTPYKMWHHKSESTSLDVSIVILPVSATLSPSLRPVLLYSPMLCCTSPQLPVFYSFGLFSLHLTLSSPCLFLLPSVADCSVICVIVGVQTELSQHHTQKGRSFAALYLLLLLFSPCLTGICWLLSCVYPLSVFPHRFPWR